MTKLQLFFFTESGTMLFVTFSYVFLQIRTIDRNMEIPHKGAFCDILLYTEPHVQLLKGHSQLMHMLIRYNFLAD